MAEIPIHVLGFAQSARGHMLPLLNVLSRCVEQGHRVTIATDICGEGDVQRLVEKMLGPSTSFEIVETRLSREEFEPLIVGREGGKRHPIIDMKELMLDGCKHIVTRLKPDVVLCDFSTLAGMEAAAMAGVPLVINVPGPVSLVGTTLGLPEPETYLQCGGVHVRATRFSGFRIAMFLNILGLRVFFDTVQKSGRKAKFLVHSFWGLEAPRELPPQVRVVGSVLPPSKELADRLASSSPELHAWLHQPGQPPTILITTGSMCALHEWQVREIFHGVKKAGIRAVWSLKDAQQRFLPDPKDPSFWVGAWLPQAELLTDPLIRAVVSHCGWGGVLETLTAGKPVVCMPFFGDQPDNAKMLEECGCGLLISRLPKMAFTSDNKYTEGMVTAESAAKVFREVIDNESYASAAKRMQRYVMATGGRDEAAREIYLSGRYGNDNISSNSISRTWGGNPFAGVASACLGGAVAGLLWCFHGPGLAAAGLVGLAGGASCAKKRS